MLNCIQNLNYFSNNFYIGKKLVRNLHFDFFLSSSSSGVFGNGLSIIGEVFDVFEEFVILVDVVDIEPDVDEVEFEFVE